MRDRPRLFVVAASPGDRPPLRRAHACLFGTTAAAALIVVLAAVATWGFGTPVSVSEVVLFAAILVAGELSRQRLYDDGSTSLEIVPIVAVGVLAGPLAVPVIVLMMTVGFDLIRRSLRPATIFNLATLTLAGTLAVAAFRGAAAVGSGAGWWALACGLLAGSVYYWSSEPLMALAFAFETDRPFTSAFRERHTWLLPHYAMQGLLASGLVLGARALGPLGIAIFSMPAVAATIATAQFVRRTERMVSELRSANASLERLLGTNRELLAALGHQHLATIRGLARAIDAKDPYTAGHTERVAQYAVMVARELGLPAELHRQIEHGALLHDIGKIGVPDHVLSKTTALDEADWQAMRRHPEIACFILDGIDLPPVVLDIVRSHHENIDGTGYPDRLAAGEVSLAARIGRVADAFDAMTSIRPYRGALTVDEARVELLRCSGSQFCNDVVAAMQRLIDRGAVDAIVPPPLGLERSA